MLTLESCAGGENTPAVCREQRGAWRRRGRRPRLGPRPSLRSFEQQAQQFLKSILILIHWPTNFSVWFLFCAPPPPCLQSFEKNHQKEPFCSGEVLLFTAVSTSPRFRGGKRAFGSNPPVPPDRLSVIKPDSLSFFSETLGVSFAHSCRLHIRSTSDGSIRQA